MNYKKILLILTSAFLITGCSSTQKQASTENINTSQTDAEISILILSTSLVTSASCVNI